MSAFDDEEPSNGDDWRNDLKRVPEEEEPLKTINRKAVIAILIGVGVVAFGGIVYTIAHRSKPAHAETPGTGRIVGKAVGRTPDSINGALLASSTAEPSQKMLVSTAPTAADTLPMMHSVPPISEAYPEGYVTQGEHYEPRNYHARIGKRDSDDADSSDEADLPPMAEPKKKAEMSSAEGLTPPSLPLGQTMQVPSGAGVPQVGQLAAALAGESGDDKQEAFMGRSGIETLGSDEEQMSECDVSAGRPVVGNLLVATNSDVPSGNTVTFSVTKAVYCGADRQHVAIPQGSTFVGEVNSRVGYGTTRQQLCMKQLERPASSASKNGSRKQLGCFVVADIQGAAGMEADVDNHWGAVIGGSLLTAVLGMGASASMGNQQGFAPTMAQNAAHGAGESINQAGQRIVSRELMRKPTLTTQILEGVTVMFTSNLQLEPWVPRSKKHRRALRW